MKLTPAEADWLAECVGRCPIVGRVLMHRATKNAIEEANVSLITPAVLMLTPLEQSMGQVSGMHYRFRQREVELADYIHPGSLLILGDEGSALIELEKHLEASDAHTDTVPLSAQGPQQA